MRLVYIFIILWLCGQAAFIGPDVWQVYQTGMCPGGPPDISPYECTVGHFLARMYFGPFALMGQIMFLIATGFFSLIIYSIAVTCSHVMKKIRQS